MGECPYCGASFDVDEFDDLEDNGDFVIGTSYTVCPTCGATLHVTAHFTWDGCLEID
jgi:hypothetical protein